MSTQKMATPAKKTYECKEHGKTFGSYGGFRNHNLRHHNAANALPEPVAQLKAVSVQTTITEELERMLYCRIQTLKSCFHAAIDSI